MRKERGQGDTQTPRSDAVTLDGRTRGPRLIRVVRDNNSCPGDSRYPEKGSRTNCPTLDSCAGDSSLATGAGQESSFNQLVQENASESLYLCLGICYIYTSQLIFV